MKSTQWHTFGDINPNEYGGGFWRLVSDRAFQFIELTNMDEACGSDNEGQPRYVVELSMVDLKAIPQSELDAAVRSCGTETEASKASDPDMAYTVWQYGLRAPLGSWSGNNAHKLLRAAKSRAHELRNDAAELAEQMAAPVNAIGSTAAEFMRGDINAAMARGIQEGRTDARIMGKMHGLTDAEMNAAALQSAPVVILKQSDILRCKFAILVPSHYRPDGTCLCDDAEHRAMMIAEWGYSEADFADVPLRGAP